MGIGRKRVPSRLSEITVIVKFLENEGKAERGRRIRGAFAPIGRLSGDALCFGEKEKRTTSASDFEMAKWGEGDPRWIVEERPDAINVNNWHWSDFSPRSSSSSF